MITNDRQYRITRTQVLRFKSALDAYDPLELVRQGLDPVIVEAQRDGMEQQLRELERAILKYESLRSSEQTYFAANSISEIGDILIEARVAYGLTQRDLASRLGMREQQIQRYEQERYQTANLTRVAEVARALDLTVFSECRLTQPRESSSALSFDPRKLPVRQMKKRGWLDAVELDGQLKHADFELAGAFVTQATGGNQLTALHRQNLKLGAKADPYAILAWKARVLQKARALRGHLGTPRNLDPIFIKKLVGLSTTPDGIVEAVQLLRAIGVIVVFEEHLQTTYLDGAALLLDSAVPVVAMTLRHDRLDNFWFVLLHELGHIVRHRDSGLQDGFFDDASVPAVAQMEGEADEFASGALIPDEIWKASFVRFTKSRDQVLEFALRIGVGASVVAGRIRNERNDYGLFSDLVGSGEVKKRIVDANLMDV
jgi:HTH-type transcriptional regulator/antitoxin HigA